MSKISHTIKNHTISQEIFTWAGCFTIQVQDKYDTNMYPNMVYWREKKIFYIQLYKYKNRKEILYYSFWDKATKKITINTTRSTKTVLEYIVPKLRSLTYRWDKMCIHYIDDSSKSNFQKNTTQEIVDVTHLPYWG